MSGSPSCASTEPSTNSTSECTIDCGWTTTSTRSGGTSKSQRASITSSPLFISVAESIVIFGPISQFGWRSASLDRRPRDARRVPGAEGAARGGQDQARHVLAPLPGQRLEDRAVLAVDRQQA